MKEIKELKFTPKKLHQSDIDFFKKLERTRQKNYINSKKEEFKKWYPKNKFYVDSIFKNLINSIDNNEIILNSNIETIYNDFIVFAFKYSN